MAFTVECLESAREARSRAFLDGGQQLAVVGYEGVGGEGREETYLTEICQRTSLVHNCLLSFYYVQKDYP